MAWEGTRPPMLLHGHPGRSTSPTMQHMLVDWVGLEDEPARFAGGYCPAPPTVVGRPCRRGVYRSASSIVTVSVPVRSAVATAITGVLVRVPMNV